VTLEEVQSKLAVLRDNLERLAQIPQGSFEEFAADFRNLDSALHRLQTSIQALIDLGSFAMARLGLGVPGTSREILERLEAAGELPPGSTGRFGPIFGFRNRVVHLYDRLDPSIVYEILTQERGDIEDLLRLLLTVIEKRP
jgi:uncharacterized protein YutE (UPF0331/DUF86 family)